MTITVPLFKVHMPASVDEPLLKVLHSGYIAQGAMVDEFEKRLIRWVNNENLLALNAGTTGLYLALKLAGVGKGDEVISTPMTCMATNAPIVTAGASIAWADINPETGNVDPATIEPLVKKKTKAIMCVHWGGYPCMIFNTKVIVKNGANIEIKEIGRLINNIPDYVLGLDNNLPSWVKVKGVTKRYFTENLIKIKSDGKEIIVTPNHLFFTKEFGWLEAGLLAENMHLNHFTYVGDYDNISVGNENEISLLDKRKNINFEKDISHCKFNKGDNDSITRIQLESNKIESYTPKFEIEKSGADNKKISSFKENERDRESIYCRNYRRRGDNFPDKIYSWQYVYSLCSNLEYGQKVNRLHNENSGFFSSSKMSQSPSKFQILLFNNVEEFSSRKIIRNNHPLFNSQKNSSRNGFGLLQTSSRSIGRNKTRSGRSGNYPEDPSSKWVKIDSIETVKGNCFVYDLITNSKNFFANGILVHNCDLDEINAIASNHGLKVIEDAAHAFGAKYKDKVIGSVSDYTMFSFQAIKHLTTIDGGLLCCKSKDDYERGRRLRWFGIDRNADSKASNFERDIEEAGYKWHMNDVEATIGIEQLNWVGWVLRRHRENAAFYDYELRRRKIKKIKPLKYEKDRVSSYWLYTVFADNVDAFISFMAGCGVQASRVHGRNDKHSCFKQFAPKKPLKGLEEFTAKQCAIPVHWGLTSQDRMRVINSIEEYERKA